MKIIGEKGRLFGVLNIIDALVILLVVAVMAAGVALVTGVQGEPNEPESTRYATISYTVPLESDAATLKDGETLTTIRGDER